MKRTIHLSRFPGPILKSFLSGRKSAQTQYLISVLAVCLATVIGFFINDILGYRAVAFILLVTVSLLAILLDILPVLLAALLSALIWDFFFIPPTLTFTVGQPEDRILLITYFLIAMISGVLTLRIRKAKREIEIREEKANSLKLYNTLLNSLSHELRTPITTIIGSTDGLITNASRLSEADRSELLKEISIASLRLNQQVENLLSMSRLESGFLKVNRDWCDVNDLVYKTLERLDGSLARFKVEVKIPDQLPFFKIDFGLMEQVIYNLLNNVIQHSLSANKITIDASAQSDSLVLVVTDNGSGFPESEIDRVFEKFYRIKGSGTGGTGLGLSIVKGFVEAHGGKIELRNVRPSGAQFTISIPAEKPN